VNREQKIRSLQKAIASIEHQIIEHEKKWVAYSRNPSDYDNQNFLRDAPTDEIRQRIIQGRMNKLRREIQVFRSELVKLHEQLAQLGE